MRTTLACLALALASGCAPPPDDTAADETSALGGKADGSAWQKIMTCDGGAAVLDVNADERRNLQLVIRDQNIVDWLNQVGAAHSAYGAREVILSGWTGAVDWGNPLGPRLNAQPYGGAGVFQPGDFQELIADHDTFDGPFGAFSRVARDGGGVKVQWGSIEKRGCAQSTTEYVGDGYGWVTSCVADYSAYVEKANWSFQACR